MGVSGAREAAQDRPPDPPRRVVVPGGVGFGEGPRRPGAEPSTTLPWRRRRLPCGWRPR